MQRLTGQGTVVVIIQDFLSFRTDLPGTILGLWHPNDSPFPYLRWVRIAHPPELYLLYIRNYQANASGDSPPGPGQISSNFFISSSPSLISTARRLSVSCSIVRGPMMGAVTTGFASSQASATLAGASPSSPQNCS